MYIKYALWSALAGGLIPVMGVLNARLGMAIGNPLQAPVILLIVALASGLAASLALTSGLPSTQSVARAAPLELAGGLIVCFYVFSATLLAPRIGIGNFILFAVCAQIITSAAIDYFGWFGIVAKEISPLRAGGLILLLVGLLTTQLANR
ncbi:MAG: DMT family transporter [Betaproteobacteria bacterium]|jgi:bacterial/archaeal transporter family-2 protein